VTEAPAFSVVADVAIVKGDTPAADRTWLTFPDGTARRAVVHVIHDLPHLIVESAFGLDDGFWGTLAGGGLSRAGLSRAGRAGTPHHSRGRLRLITSAPPGEFGTVCPGQLVAKAAVDAVLNRWNDGPDTPAGVRARLRCSGPGAAELAGQLDDETIQLAAVGVRRLYRDWSMLPPGGTLRLTWPLHTGWLRS
jgi:hypothetical protein